VIEWRRVRGKLSILRARDYIDLAVCLVLTSPGKSSVQHHTFCGTVTTSDQKKSRLFACQQTPPSLVSGLVPVSDKSFSHTDAKR